MTNILTMRTFFSVALLAILTLGTACSDDDIVHEAAEKAEQLGAQAEDAIVQRARALADDTREGAAAQAEANQRVAAIGHRMGHALDEEARELTDAIRSGRDALAAETALLTEAVKQEASELARAARAGGISQAAGDAGAAEQAIDARGGVEGVANELEKNVEHSAETYDESYNAARKSGENVIEAGGQAYNSVVDIPRERTND